MASILIVSPDLDVSTADRVGSPTWGVSFSANVILNSTVVPHAQPSGYTYTRSFEIDDNEEYFEITFASAQDIVAFNSRYVKEAAQVFRVNSPLVRWMDVSTIVGELRTAVADEFSAFNTFVGGTNVGATTPVGGVEFQISGIVDASVSPNEIGIWFDGAQQIGTGGALVPGGGSVRTMTSMRFYSPAIFNRSSYWQGIGFYNSRADMFYRSGLRYGHLKPDPAGSTTPGAWSFSNVSIPVDLGSPLFTDYIFTTTALSEMITDVENPDASLVVEEATFVAASSYSGLLSTLEWGGYDNGVKDTADYSNSTTTTIIYHHHGAVTNADSLRVSATGKT